MSRAEPFGGPTDLPIDEIHELTCLLVDEVDTILRHNSNWALTLNESTMVRLHAGAALWHCCELLLDLVELAQSGREMAMRIITRAHSEAFVKGLYIHRLGIDALNALESDYKATLQAQKEAVEIQDRALRKETERAHNWNEKVRHDNAGKGDWNEAHPNDEPRVPLPSRTLPGRPEIGPGIGRAIDKELVNAEDVLPQALTMPDVIAALNQWSLDNTDGSEHFGIMYDVGYRIQSTIGVHLNLGVLSQYLPDGEGREFFARVLDAVRTPSYSSTAVNTALPATAYLANRVLGEAGSETPVAVSILEKFKDPEGDPEN